MASDDFKITYSRPPSKLFDLEETRKIVEQELTTASIKSVGEFHGALIPRTPFAFGFLRNSFMQKVFKRGRDIIGQVRSTSPYAWPVEEGSKPHFPPIAPIELWVRRKLQVKENAKAIAFMIARKISIHGTKAVHMVRDTFREKQRPIESNYKQALSNITQRIARL